MGRTLFFLDFKVLAGIIKVTHTSAQKKKMSETDTINRLEEAAKEQGYDPKVFHFVLTSLEYVMSQLPQRQHINGQTLAKGVKSLAMANFGPLARTVLEDWGVHSTEDLGRVVKVLVQEGVMQQSEGDSIHDFESVYSFDEFDKYEIGSAWRKQQDSGRGR